MGDTKWDYTMMAECAVEFLSMSSLEIQNQIKPIIKSYGFKELSNMLNVSEGTLRRYCKKAMIENDERPKFDVYVRLLALGVNPNLQIKVKKDMKEYMHEYYLNVLKSKRRGQRE